jgi:hypothetical protein
MSQARDRLYNLLPAIYRPRDELAGRPLQALLAVIENEFNLLEIDLAATYDNWFIETCDAWVIPYLADLVGIADQAIFEQPFFGQRRLVANHIAYQRRKGLAAILALMARDVSGWHAYVVDLSQRVAQTQSMKHVKRSQGKTLDLRQGEELALLGTAFDRAARTLDVRRVDADTRSGSLPGLVSPNALGLYLWRLQSYPVRQAQAGVPAGIRPHYRYETRHSNGLVRTRSILIKTRHFTFDPLGRELPLFIQPETIDHLDGPVGPGHFPQPLTRKMLAVDLAQPGSASNQSDFSLEDDQKSSRYYGPQKEIAIWLNGCLVPADEILCGSIRNDNTADWDEQLRAFNKRDERKTAVVDPENGRLLLARAVARDKVTVNYTYGFSHNLGSGPFRQDGPDAADRPARQNAARIDIVKSSLPLDWDDTIQRVRCREKVTVSSLKEALDLWQELCGHGPSTDQPPLACEDGRNKVQPPQAIIRFLDSGTYHLSGPLQPSLPSGSYLSIEAAPGERPTIMVKKRYSQAPRKPKGPGPIANDDVFDRHFRLQGLLVRGRVALPAVSAGKLDFQIKGCTFLDGLDLHISEKVLLDFKISSSVIDSIRVEPSVDRKGSLLIEDSLVRGGVSTKQSGDHKDSFVTGIYRSTIFGDAELLNISQIKDSILMGRLTVEKIEMEQVVMQYSYVAGTDLPETNRAYCIIGSQVQPVFTSTQPTHPGYAQLRVACPQQIRNGASNGAEMGAFNSLQENRREANLKLILPDYLPLGQKIGLFKVT